MKYLTDYTNDKQTELFEKTGTFFAFNQEQFEEEKKKYPAEKYYSLGGGMYVNQEHYKELKDGLQKIQTEAMAQDLKENGRKGVIHRELGNYEVQITGDLTDAIEALEPYGITVEEVRKEYPKFFQTCITNDWF